MASTSGTPSKQISSKQINVSSMAFKIIETIAQKCNEEKKNKMLTYPLEDSIQRVVYYTGTSLNYVKRFHSISSDDKKEEFFATIYDRVQVYKALGKLYEMELPPTVDGLIQECNVSLPVPLFDRMLKQMGYENKITENGSNILVENTEITFDRFNYLRKVTRARQSGKDIYYVDERYIDADTKFSRPWALNKSEENSSELKDSYIFYSVVSKFGFQNGIFCNQIVTEDFEKWMVDIILPNLKKSSIVIMENAPHHRPTTIDRIKKSDTKDILIKWLRNNNIPYSPDMHKAELYDLVQKFWKPEIKYGIDEIFKAHGHQVLRLPQTLYDLTISDLMWNHIKGLLSEDDSIDSLLTLKILIRGNLVNIISSKWIEFDNAVRDLEKQLYDIEIGTDLALQKFKFGEANNETSMEAEIDDIECIEIS